MGFEDTLEKGQSRKPSTKAQHMTLQKAIELEEYNPEYLATFPELGTLSKHVQFQFIRQGLENRRKQLITQWADINNMLDFRLKPHLKDSLKNIEKQLNTLKEEGENLYVEYSKF